MDVAGGDWAGIEFRERKQLDRTAQWWTMNFMSYLLDFLALFTLGPVIYVANLVILLHAWSYSLGNLWINYSTSITISAASPSLPPVKLKYRVLGSLQVAGDHKLLLLSHETWRIDWFSQHDFKHYKKNAAITHLPREHIVQTFMMIESWIKILMRTVN